MNGGDGNSGHGTSEWDAFDFEQWGNGVPGAPGSSADVDGSAAGQRAAAGEDGERGERGEEGHWESVGGVLRWEGADEGAEAPTLREEASSRWAAEEVDLPPGAPDAARLLATRAWLARQRVLESEALGLVLLERRRLYPEDTDAPSSQPDGEESPLDLAIADHTAAMQEYEQLIEQLAELAAHSGPARVLVEYYLALNERLAELASAPEAPADFAARVLLAEVEDEEAADSAGERPTPRAFAEWQARAQSVLLARRRVERVTLPDLEE